MCGYLGSVTFQPIDTNKFEHCNNNIECRGPDEKILINNKIYKDNLHHNFAFNRLSIIDLSSKASQPMFSSQFESMIMFNGEIFNHREIRKYLENKEINFLSSHSDTEVLLLGLSKFGPKFLDMINGQFSIFFYDIKNSTYYLIRDRAGQKPLYYSIDSSGIYFGSNLTSVKNLSDKKDINDEEILNYINLGTSITPNTYFKNIQSVAPGEFIQIKVLNDSFEEKKIQYWNLENYLDERKFDEYEFLDIFKDSVKIRLESDVPVSNFLSGGLDSTAVIKAAADGNENINTFSMITNSKKFNESKYINLVVEKYNTNHTYHVIDSDIDFEEIKNLIKSFDDIIYDPSIIPTYMLSKKIAEEYKVALSGDGGDELLSGYSHYKSFHSNTKVPDFFTNSLFKNYPSHLGSGNNVLKYSNNWKPAFSSYYEDKKFLQLLNIEIKNDFSNYFLKDKNKNWKSLMSTDHKFFLNELMLKKIDRSSMLNSLEVRSPFLDHRLFQFIASHNYPSPKKGFENKKVIKNFLSNDFDSDFLNRKKMGFSIDIKQIVNQNKEEIFEQIMDSYLTNLVDFSSLNKILQINTRVNSLRLWKLFTISLYLKENSS